MGYIVGVDIGGTFTDCVVLSDKGELTIAKASSTPPSFAEGALEAVRAAARQLGHADEQEVLKSTSLFFHGCTVGDNAIYTRSGARTALVVTRGFGDILEMMRGDVVTGLREEEAAHTAGMRKPAPLVPRERIVEAVERVDSQGSVVVPLDDAGVEDVVSRLGRLHVDAVAVCLLWSFADRTHEEKISSALRAAFPRVFVSASADVVPFLGEYERMATTVFNAYIGPILSNYLMSLTELLAAGGLRSAPLIMQSYGGALNADAARKVPIGTVESGPVAGVMAARAVGEDVDASSLLAIDMGGTTFKVGLIKDGRVEREVNPSLLRYRLLWPKVWVQSMGAGGGSIARYDERSGLVKVGPEGAGAVPGPVCYSRGGSEPTVTDANLVLGLLNPDYFLGGELKLDRAAAERAIVDHIGAPLSLDAVSASEGIVRIVDAQMADLIKAATIRRGHDPRTMTLIAYGGAGPLHAVSLARQLGIGEVVIPVTASVHSAYGLVMSDVVREFGRTVHYVFPPPDAIVEEMAALVEEARRTLLADGFQRAQIGIECGVDMRYRYQVNEITVPVDWETASNGWDLVGLGDGFDLLYAARYGKEAGYREAGKEIVAIRVRGIGFMARPEKTSPLAIGKSGPDTVTRTVHFPGSGAVRARILQIGSLKIGEELSGPAVIETPVTSIALHDGDKARVDNFGHVRITVSLHDIEAAQQ